MLPPQLPLELMFPRPWICQSLLSNILLFQSRQTVKMLGVNRLAPREGLSRL
jgi:hypothetical protein